MLFWRSDDPQIGHACMAAVQEQRAWIAETQISRGDGSSLWVLVEALPKFDRKGACNGHIVTLSDISREKQLLERLQENEARLEQARKEAELAAQAKAKFLEPQVTTLGKPLQAASLFIAVLQNRIDEAQRQLILDKLQKSLGALENLLRALLEISELEAELGQPIASVFSTAQLFLQLEEEFAAEAAAKNVRLRVFAPSCYLRTDRSYLERLVRNLLAHVLSCTSEGEVLLGARRRGNHLRVEIWDTGKQAPAPEQRSTRRALTLYGTGTGRRVWNSLAPNASPSCWIAHSRQQPGQVGVGSAPSNCRLRCKAGQGNPPLSRRRGISPAR